MTIKDLCKYYIHCISLESNTTLRVSLKNATSFWVLPWVNNGALMLGDISSFLYGNKEKEQDLLIGYPVLKVGTTLSPLFIMRITFSDGTHGRPVGFTIDEEVNFNKDVIDKYSTNDASENIFELRGLETELGITGGSDAVERLPEIVARLREIRPTWDWQDELDLDNLTKTAVRENEPDGILNRAIVIAKEPTPYTIGLSNELARLSEYTQLDIRSSILYKFLTGQTAKSTMSKDPVLEVLPLNAEQKLAIQTALRSDVTLIAGPPGTGKTQVVANLIINAVIDGQTVLFTSKNNNAVDVVVKRVNSLNQEHPLILRYEKNVKQSVSDFVQQWEKLRVRELANRPVLDEYQDQEKAYQKRLIQKNTVMDLRNRMDAMDQDVQDLREEYPTLFGSLTDGDVSQLEDAYEVWMSSLLHRDDKPRKISDKLRKNRFEANKKEAIDTATAAFNEQLHRYRTSVSATPDMSERERMHLDAIYQDLTEKLHKIADFNFLVRQLQDNASLEQIDMALLREHAMLQKKAKATWDYLLDQRAALFSGSSRMALHDYMSLLEHGEVDSFPSSVRHLLPAHAITSLSARRRIPFMEGVYDLLIIDEASQCDIASMIPLLMRAKRVVVIGDKQQLNHICLLNKQTDLQLMRYYGITEARWSYRANSIYDLASSMVSANGIVQLRDHHRSFFDIIQFSNQEFYDNTLRVATDYSRLKAPDNGKPVVGVQWMNVKGQTIRPEKGGAYNLNEAEAVVRMLRRLTQELHFEGSIGVTTPFHWQADMITKAIEADDELRNALELHNQLLVDTVHKFQGDERDVIIFSPVVSRGTMSQSLQFLKSTGNLFNVAITRARSLLVTVGDKEFCKQCGVSYLEHFAEYSVGDNAPVESSEWEHLLQKALSDAGIPVTAQYHVDKYYLDLALFHKGKKLDIEVDGALYHQTWDHELCYNDQLRNQTLMRQGWDVLRFWVQQVRDDLPWCISQIRQWMDRC